MGIASLVIGLICLLFSPILSILLIIPAIIGLALGIVDVILKNKKNLPKGISIAGIVLSTIALCISVLFFMFYITHDFLSETSSDSITDTPIDEVIIDVFNDDLNCNLNESVIMDNVRVTFENIDTNFTDYDDYAYIDDGYKVLKADFKFDNIGSSYEYLTSYDFDCYADGELCDTFYYVDDYYFSESLEPGDSADVSVYFEIPQNTNEIEIEYDSNSYDDKTIVFHAENSNLIITEETNQENI